MPRQAHGRPLVPSGPSNARKKKATRGRGLNALETAEKQFPEKIKIRQHRLGEDEEDVTQPQSRADADGRSAKRRKLDIHNGETGSMDEGSDLDGERWHVGVEDEDEDSDIDSDEAFGESDEERFAGFTFRGSSTNVSGSAKRKSKTNARGPEQEDEDRDDSDQARSEDDSDLGEDAVDLAAALDMNEEDERRVEKRLEKTLRSEKEPENQSFDDGENSDVSEVGSSEQDGSDVFSEFSVSEDEVDADTTQRLRAFVDELTPAQRVTATPNKNPRPSALPTKPSQYALPSSRLSAADLMQYVKDPTQRQSLKIIQAAEQEEPEYRKGGIPGKLAAPLAKRQQDRLDRVAAYDQGKQTLERWVDTVKQNRRAEHVSYPLRDAAKDSASNAKSFQPMNKQVPQTNLESKIQEIMRESGINTANKDTDETAEQRYEELKEKQIPLEEVQARRRELRLQRELMFREEIRAKRIKRIKSKAFRRVHRKERDKLEVQQRERLAAAGMLNSDDEREQNDRKRAEERMGARHRESKWAKAAKATGQTTWNEDAKMGVSELARRDEELRRRIEGKTVHDSDESGEESDVSSEYYSADDSGDDRWRERLESLKAVPATGGKSKLADMAFMKKAEAVREAQNDEELRLLKRAMMGDEGSASQGDSDIEDAPIRQKFGKHATQVTAPQLKAVERNEFEAPLSEDEGENVLLNPQEPTADLATVPKPSSTTLGPPNVHHNRQAVPPKMQLNGRSTEVLIAPQRMPQPRSRANGVEQSALADYTSPSESEAEAQDEGLDAKSKLALEIFAGDDEEDLVGQFEKEKKEIVEDEGDQVVDNTLPGWGSWTGAGISKREQKRAKGQSLSVVKGIAPDKRKDAKLERVVINEKRVKKNGRYLATELPHPYESRQQYERTLRLPMGPEWSTRNHFQDSIKPRVLLKQGQIIKPLAKPTA